MDSRRARSFGSAAAAYDRGRPTYPEPALRWVMPPGTRRVLDLGAGTGKLTRALLELDLDVIAVEPNAAMRAALPPGALAGTAEQIPLADACVDAVLVGQAFHWFDPTLALPEVVRVLRPGGALGVMWNLFDDRVPWVADLCAVWQPEETMSAVGPVEVTFAVDGLSGVERIFVQHEQQMDWDLLEDNLRSRSAFILMSVNEREERLMQARAVAPPDRFALPYVCDTRRAFRTRQGLVPTGSSRTPAAGRPG